MKTSELTGAELDYWVAKARGWELDGVTWREWITQGDRGYYCEQAHKDDWRPSTDWAQGGPIIERERIAVVPYFGRWHARRVDLSGTEHFGPTPLISGMRAFVSSVFVQDVDASGEEPTQ